MPWNVNEGRSGDAEAPDAVPALGVAAGVGRPGPYEVAAVRQLTPPVVAPARGALRPDVDGLRARARAREAVGSLDERTALADPARHSDVDRRHLALDHCRRLGVSAAAIGRRAVQVQALGAVDRPAVQA